MSSSISTLSRRLCRTLLSIPKPYHQLSLRFSTSTHLPSGEEDPGSDEFTLDSDIDPIPDSPPSQSSPDSSSSPTTTHQRVIYDRPLENGLDVGVYKAILVGQVGQSPLQKRLRSGTVLTLLSVGTGGIRNNRRPLANESPWEYAERSAIQWHRVSVYPERLGSLVMKHVVPGSILYLEGNLESKVFTDPITGLVRRIREVAIRRNGRIVFLSQGGDAEQRTQNNDVKAVGYY